MDVSVVIVNYNGKENLKRCLSSLSMQSYTGFEIIVVDNGSKDGSEEMVREEFAGVKLIRNKKNLFFARAYNQAIKETKGKYLLILNNDVRLDKDFIKNAVEKFKLNPRIGSVCGKVLGEEGRFIDSTGQFLSYFRKARERGYKEKDYGKYDYEGYVFGAPGACAFYRKEMLKDIKDRHGYFDERFKAYLEDLDLNWRANRKGWLCYYTPSAIAYHRRGSTGWSKNFPFGFLNLPLKFKFIYFLNRYRTIVKNDSLFYFLKCLPAIFIYDFYLFLGIVFHLPLNIIALLKNISKIITERPKLSPRR